MARTLAIAAFLLGALGVGVAGAACVPFGGDDSGCVPPDSDNLKYESKIGKNLNKFQKCALKCHEGRADGKYVDTTTEENCEDACKGKYDAANVKLTAPPASSCVNPDALRQFWQSYFDLNNSLIYCEGTTPFGGDDTGNIPSNPDTLKCEKKVGSNAAKLLKCQSKCHAKEAKASIDATEEDTCEDACRAKFDGGNTKLSDCLPPCLNTTVLGNSLRSTGDSNNGQVYCAM
jgi:hypothetical protein